MCWKERSFAAPVLVVAACALSSGCAAPLAQIIKEDAPGYLQKLPATSTAMLGSRLDENGQPVSANACFKGEESGGPASSWKNRWATYGGKAGVAVKAEFDKLVTVEGSLEGNFELKVRLRDVKEHALTHLYFNPSSTCATDDTERDRYKGADGVIDRVLTKALRAEAIDLEQAAGAATRVAVNVVETGGVKIGGEGGGETQGQDGWEGVKLYFAHYAERFKVTLKEAHCPLSTGSGLCEIGTCSLRLVSLENDAWTGGFSCQGQAPGEGEKSLAGALDAWTDGVRLEGVSYSIRVRRSSQVGVADADLLRWNVMNCGGTDPSVCAPTP